jgi:hypothetical protein
MKLPHQPYHPPVSHEPVTIADLNKAIDRVWEELARVINGRLWFGSVVTGRENLDGIPLLKADTGVANVAFTLTHNLGRVPVGWLVTYIDKATSIYDGGVAWTETTISLKSSTANVRLIVFVF